ncbi:DNA-binding protein [Anaerobacillus arseniciselenatis]|uniref:DNA-binding protein n=1 Tax=Anaerobacillus arseniciselenatis TaxID=85682 RepID=A0A1S2LMP8_9BACI|nr:helix-turn-helix domain-containing protein [Anaerobacillus arseniciselenatis]OIJ13808.1 DNA-binding protein [Anaerobacillus arseniciselenatis]
MSVKTLNEDYPIVLTASDIAEILQISKPTVYELMRQRDFPIISGIGNIKRVKRDAFFAWLDKRSQQAG